MTIDEQRVVRRNRLMLLGIVAIAVIPMLGAYLLYRATASGEPWATTNEGTLLSPPHRYEDLALIDAETGTASSALEKSGTWWLLTVPAGSCDEVCLAALDKNRALHVLLAKDTARLRRAIVFADGVEGAEFEDLKARFPKLFVLETGVPLEPGLYIGDPIGNLILHYGFDQAGKPVLNDLKRLLRISQVG